MNFLTAQNKAKSLTPARINNDLFRFIRSIEQELVAYNKATLFQDSEDVDGKPIGFYSKASELISGKVGPFDLFVTGEFLESIFAKAQKDSIFFGASDPKTKDVLSNLLTDNIFGLQDDDLNKVINTRILPFFINYFRKELI